VLRRHPRVKGCTGRGAVELEEILGQGASWEANEALYKVEVSLAKRRESVHTVSGP